MKSKKKPYILIVTIVFMVSSLSLKSQTQVVEFIMGGVQDGERLIQAYLEPLGNAMGANLNSGWYNTAKVHRTLGFDITFTITAAIPPEAAKTFDLSAIGLTTLRLKDPANYMAPTISGSKDKGPKLLFNYHEHDLELFEFESIGGLNIPVYPLPMIKAAVGLPKGIEVMGRFFPKYTYNDMSVYLWGAGMKYDVLQNIPGISRFPFLNASVFGAYTNVSFSSSINFQRNYYSDIIDMPVEGGKINYDNQNLDINMRGFTLAALVSYDLPVITLYGGAGYGYAITNIDLKGDYPVISDVEFDDAEPKVVLGDLNDPISLDFENFSGLQLNGGIRLKFAVVTLHAEFTKSNYNMVSAGLGFSFR